MTLTQPASAAGHAIGGFWAANGGRVAAAGRVLAGSVLARSDRHRSWSLFTQALDSDLADIQGGTTREGGHLGAMAGRVDRILRSYAGLEIRDAVLRLHPSLPPELGHAGFEIVYRGQPISVELTRDQVRFRLHPHGGDPITVCMEDQLSVLSPGDEHVVALAPETPVDHIARQTGRASAQSAR